MSRSRRRARPQAERPTRWAVATSISCLVVLSSSSAFAGNLPRVSTELRASSAGIRRVVVAVPAGDIAVRVRAAAEAAVVVSATAAMSGAPGVGLEVRRSLEESLPTIERRGDALNVASSSPSLPPGAALLLRVEVSLPDPTLALEVRFDFGSLRIHDLSGPVSVVFRRGHVDLERLAGEVSVRGTSGSVRLAQRRVPPRSCEIRLGQGNVLLLLPDLAPASFSLRTKYGGCFIGPGFGGDETRPIRVRVEAGGIQALRWRPGRKKEPRLY